MTHLHLNVTARSNKQPKIINNFVKDKTRMTKHMFQQFNLTFTPVTSKYVQSRYKKATTIVEYGSGGSTILAAKEGKTIISTESSSEWMIELMGAYKEQDLPGDIIPIYVDIGETKKFGYPVDNSQVKSYPNYAKKAWRYCSEHKIHPDLVLVDGRFRVACFIASCISIKKPCTILFDDFVDRKHYHIVKKIVEPVDIIDERMAVFDIKPNMVSTKFLLDQMNYFLAPA